MSFFQARSSYHERISRFINDDNNASDSGSNADLESSDDQHLLIPLGKHRPRFRIVPWAQARLRATRRNLLHPLRLLFVCRKYLALLAAALLVFVPLFAPSYVSPPSHYSALKARCHGGGKAVEPGCANAFNEKVFIAVSLYDKGGHLAGGPWGKALLDLIDLLGPKNVYLSIYENDSGPEAAAALEQLKNTVQCRHSIVNDAHVDMGIFPNITMPDGTPRMKRLAYLSEMRNRALRPLDLLNEEEGIVPFDKVLFLNDVAFRPVDAAQLLFSTNVGSDGRTSYTSVCGLDYRNPFLFYDLYAQRDAEGYSNGLPFFPIFSNAGQGFSRSDMLAQRDAVRVKACWGGIVAMQAKFVQNHQRTLPRPDFQQIGAHVIDPSHPRNVSAPVRFRYEPELFFDACECCLLHADVAQAARQTGLEEAGTFVNPYVRVAYDWKVLDREAVVRRWERLFAIPHAILSPLAGLPRRNPHRTIQEGNHFLEEVWSVEKQTWEMVERAGRNGLFCGVRETQILMRGKREGDKNWVQLDIPPGQRFDFPS